MENNPTPSADCGNHEQMSKDDAVRTMKNILYNVEKVIIGKRYAIELVMISLACRGHVLIEDVPGVGKTSLVSAMARSVDCSFKRIQFTPDIMPSDITGFSIYSPKTEAFEYKPGAVMCQFVLADEINRTSPKTQSSLLEVMEENQITVDGITYEVPQPFMVLATQNPVEYLGTYPLPEAQLDRFFIKVSIGYPSKSEESRMIGRFQVENPLATLKPVASGEDVLQLQRLAEKVFVHKEIYDYIVSLVQYTRTQEDIVILGASPRSSLCLCKAAQAWALYHGQAFVTPDDVRQMAPHILEHRILLRQEAKLKKITALDVVERAIESVNTPII